ncbi:T-protein [Candidatus Erwinia haradaeae]|uniref:chorismate mutase n=1 Tax=Candidatus Erwinia haradaeae TaxID=1922217 RepID=A0A451DC13_9GAMM|nr:chorismate mutase [Candidatus Erwinia haradaeae]VFP83909.1 T-protein [Candidatus Erwinia haradaeae]
MTPKIDRLRKKIDELDKKIIRLIAERIELASTIADIKNQQGIPLYSPEREKLIISSCRKEIENLGRKNMMEDIVNIMRYIMQKSYNKKIKKVHLILNKVL